MTKPASEDQEPHSIDIADITSSVLLPGMITPLLAPLIFSLGGDPTGSATFSVTLALNPQTTTEQLKISWRADTLRLLHPNLSGDLEALRLEASPLLEKATEFSGYALAICAIDAFLPGHKVTGMSQGRSPDLWLDLGKDRGVEVAARTGARTRFTDAIHLKRTAVRALGHLRERYISVWGIGVREGHKELVTEDARA